MDYGSYEIIKSSDTKDLHPYGFELKLFNHQLATVSRMKLYETMFFSKTDPLIGKIRINTKSAVISTHKKRQSILCLVQNTLGTPLVNNYVRSNGSIGYPENDDRIVVDSTLIVYKAHMKPHWESELSKTKLSYSFIDTDIGNIIPNSNVILVDFRKMYILFNTDYKFKRCIIDTDGEFRQNSIFPPSLFYWYAVTRFTNIFKISQKLGMSNNLVKFLTLVTDKDDYVPKVIQVRNVQYYGNINRSISKFNIMGSVNPVYTVEMLLSNFGMCLSLDQIMHRIPYSFLSESRIQGIIDRLNICDTSCPICLEQEESTIITKCCYSYMCIECYINCLMTSSNQKSCPFCRKPNFTVYKLSNVDVETPPNRYDTILKILYENENLDKILILSDVLELPRKIKTKFQCFTTLNGNHLKVYEKLKKYKKIVMSSSQNCFAGLPLQDYDLVVVDDTIPEHLINSVLDRIDLPIVKMIKLQS